MANYTLYFDGLCQPKNPGGVATYGFVVLCGNDVVYNGKGVVGEGDGMTNNVAEYNGIVKGLDYMMHKFKSLLTGDHLTIRGDSKLVINQVDGLWKVKASNLRGFHSSATLLVKAMHDNGIIVELEWVPRDDNQLADDQTNEAFHHYCKEKNSDGYRPCPDCDGILVKKKSTKNGGEFYGCSNYPKCTHTDRLHKEITVTYKQALDKISDEYKGKFPGNNQPTIPQIAEILRVMYGVNRAELGIKEKLRW